MNAKTQTGADKPIEPDCVGCRDHVYAECVHVIRVGPCTCDLGECQEQAGCRYALLDERQSSTDTEPLCPKR